MLDSFGWQFCLFHAVPCNLLEQILSLSNFILLVQHVHICIFKYFLSEQQSVRHSQNLIVIFWFLVLLMLYVSSIQDCGWKGWGEISYGGYGCVQRAKAAEFLVYKLKSSDWWMLFLLIIHNTSKCMKYCLFDFWDDSHCISLTWGTLSQVNNSSFLVLLGQVMDRRSIVWP